MLQQSKAERDVGGQEGRRAGPRWRVEGGVGGKASEQVKAKSKLQIENERSEQSREKSDQFLFLSKQG
jgi:hypothetical protein